MFNNIIKPQLAPSKIYNLNKLAGNKWEKLPNCFNGERAFIWHSRPKKEMEDADKGN